MYFLEYINYLLYFEYWFRPDSSVVTRGLGSVSKGGQIGHKTVKKVNSSVSRALRCEDSPRRSLNASG